jgi:hypothetical protein
MNASQVLSLLTQEQTRELLVACCQYLPVDQIEAAVREGCDPIERRQLAFQLSIEFDLSGSQDD